MKKPKTSQLQPHEGALPLKLGMLQSEVRALCGTPLDKTPKYDYSHRNGLQVEYRKERVAFIQISRGFGLVAQYQGVDVLAASAEDIIKLVSTDAPYDAKHPELYGGLPSNPRVPILVQLWKKPLRWVGNLGMLVGVFGVFIHYLRFGPKIVKEDEPASHGEAQ